MIRAGGFVCAWFAFACTPAAAITCWAPGGHMVDQQAIQQTMYVVSGKACTFVARTLGPMSEVRLITPPTRGRVSIRSGLVTYVSRSGYLGDDRFVFVREGRDAMDRRVSYPIEMIVEVKERL